VRVVFMGTPDFAVPSLDALAAAHEVLLVYSRPDSASRRGTATHPSPVKEAALELGLPVRTPSTLRDPEEVEFLRGLAPDIGVVAAYGLILPPGILELPRHGFVNVHASLLPRWRGAAPIQRAILAGDEIAGVSIMQMEEGLDTGPYCEVRETPVREKSAEELTGELASLGAHALLAALERIERGMCAWTEQDSTRATYAEKISKQEVALSPELTTQEALRRIRASNRQAPARARLGDRNVTVIAASPHPAAVAAGTVGRDEQAVLLGTADGALALERVKPDGRSEMDVSAWVCGTDVPDGSTWGPAA